MRDVRKSDQERRDRVRSHRRSFSPEERTNWGVSDEDDWQDVRPRCQKGN